MMEKFLGFVEKGDLKITKVTNKKIEMRSTDGSPGTITIEPTQDGWEIFYVWRREHKEKACSWEN